MENKTFLLAAKYSDSYSAVNKSMRALTNLGGSKLLTKI